MWTIPFAGRVVRHKEQETIDLLKAIDRDKLRSRHLGVPSQLSPQEERDTRSGLQLRRPASKIMEHLYGISVGTRKSAALLDRMGLGGNKVTPGLRGLVPGDHKLEEAFYGKEELPPRRKRIYGEDFFGDDLD